MSHPALRILIVEDELMIAKQLEALARSAGHSLVGIASTAGRACELVAAAEPDLALVDVNLAEDTSGIDVANFAADRATTHVLFATATPRALAGKFYGAIGVMEKPFTRTAVFAVLAYVAGRLSGDTEPAEQPAGLCLSPAYAARWDGVSRVTG